MLTNRNSRTPASIWLLTGLALLVLTVAPTLAQEAADEKPGPPVTVEAILVQPEAPGPDTLCKLKVRLKNRSERSVSGFGFEVKVNGTALPVYEKQRYLEALEPGESRDIELYNFWSSETARPPAKDGSLTVEISLVEARWVEITTEDKIPVWTLKEEVTGLPSSLSTKKPFKK